MSKKVAILQSNYIPWKGYFDLIAAVDEFIIYDDVQFTKNDWRNRNQIKTPRGLEWLSIPVGQDINRRICDVVLPDTDWRKSHWHKLHQAYSKASNYKAVASLLEPIYQSLDHTTISTWNRALIDAICGYLGIQTKLSYVWDYACGEGKTQRLVDLCRHAGAAEYISGPAARSYLEESKFAAEGIAVTWFDYSGYPPYPQLWGEFVHSVTILDLLFNCGKDAHRYMRHS